MKKLLITILIYIKFLKLIIKWKLNYYIIYNKNLNFTTKILIFTKINLKKSSIFKKMSVTCEICLDNVEIAKIVVLKCNHQGCFDCIRVFCKSQFDNGVNSLANLKC